MLKKNSLFFLISLFIFLMFLKIDYRLTNQLVCCGDDYDYYSHAETIALDFDFDYSNQNLGESRFYRNDKSAPIGFVGTGLFASPFLFIGNMLDILLNTSQSSLNLKLLTYSYSSIFYLFFSCWLLEKCTGMMEISSNYTKLYVFGSGLVYYSFERYSMTPVYEVFTLSLLIFLVISLFVNGNQKINYLIPFVIMLGIMVRWTNYYLFFIPGLINSIFSLNKKNYIKIYTDYRFIISSIFSFTIFGLISKAIYGSYIFSPSYVYMEDEITTSIINSFLNNPFEYIINYLRNILIILFSEEFGLFWFSPVIFLGFLLVVTSIIKQPRKKTLTKLVLLIIYLQNFLVVSIWESTASSFGFRYLYSLIPISLLYVLIYENSNKLIKNYLIFFSLFNLVSVLFFESNLATQLSVDPIINSFGQEVKYSQPHYLTGMLTALLDINSYIKIIGTSFIMLVALKATEVTLGSELIINTFQNFQFSNLKDIENLIISVQNLNVRVLVVMLIYTAVLIYVFIYKKTSK